MLKMAVPWQLATRFILFLTDAVPAKCQPILARVREAPFITALVALIRDFCR